MIPLIVVAAFIGSVSARSVGPTSWVERQLKDDIPACNDIIELKPGSNGPSADVQIPFDGNSEQVIKVAADAPGQEATLVDPIQGAVLSDTLEGDVLKARFYLARTNTPDISGIEVNGKPVCQDDRPKSRSGSTGPTYKFRFLV